MYSAACKNIKCWEQLVIRNRFTGEEFTVFFWEWSNIAGSEQVAVLVPGRFISKDAKPERWSASLLAECFEHPATCVHCGVSEPAESWPLKPVGAIPMPSNYKEKLSPYQRP